MRSALLSVFGFAIMTALCCRSAAAAPAVWMMQVQVEDASSSSSGFVDRNGVVFIQVQQDAYLQLSGKGLNLVTQIAFTADNSTRNTSGAFSHMTSRFDVTDKTYNSATAKVRFHPSYTNVTMFLVIFVSYQDSPIHQGLLVRPFAAAAEPATVPLWAAILIIVFLLTLSSIFSGLNLGLLLLDFTTLKVLKESGSESEKRYSRVIEPLRKHGNFLLCSLVLGNVFVNSCMSVMLNGVVGTGATAVALSTFAIVIFGEIIPQAVCSKHGLLVGAKTRYLTIALMALTCVISWPLSKILDFILGKQIGTIYDREKLNALMEVAMTHTDLRNEEVSIAQGALMMGRTKAADIMTPLDEIFMMPIDAYLDFNTMNEIFQAGFSRIPIYDGDRTNVVGILNAKDIAFIDPDDRVPLKAVLNTYYNQSVVSMPSSIGYKDGYESGNGSVTDTTSIDTMQTQTFSTLLRVEHDLPLDRLLQRFLEHRCHMGFVCRVVDEGVGVDANLTVSELIGLVTLEDVFEELIQREILDETDVSDRHGRKVKRNRINMLNVKRSGAISISASLQIAAYQFLSNSISDLFGPSQVDRHLLMALLKNKVVNQLDYVEINTKSPSYDESTDTNFLYRPEDGVDYFVLILQGRVDVYVGKEGMRFDAGPFTAFGEQTLPPVNELLAEDPKRDIRKLARSVRQLPQYYPDYKVRAACDVQYVKIDRAAYLALRRRTIISVFSGEAQRTADIVALAMADESNEASDALKEIERKLLDDIEAIESTGIAIGMGMGIDDDDSFDKSQLGAESPLPSVKKSVSFAVVDIDLSDDFSRNHSTVTLASSIGLNTINEFEQENLESEQSHSPNGSTTTSSNGSHNSVSEAAVTKL